MIKDKIGKVKDALEGTLLNEDIFTNISKTERILSMATGSYVFLKGISNIFSSPFFAATELVIGFSLLQRGISGHCAVAAHLKSSLQIPAPILVVG